MRTVKKKLVTYKVGGFDSTKPNNNIGQESEINVPLIPVKRINFLLELQTRNLYKAVINDISKFTEREVILFNNLPEYTRELSFMDKIIESAKITNSILDDIFYNSQKDFTV
jgi:hypothetical protein